MREIKFRAWWKHPVYLPKGKMYFVGGLLFATPQKGEPEYDNCDTPKEVGLMETVNNDKIGWNPADQCTLMQYTGLKDKNGKEIYEGDVVKILHGEWMSQNLGTDEQKILTHEQYLDSLTKQYEVVFATDRFMGKRHIGYNPWETDDEGYTYTRLTPDKYGYVEVIGNIYENPELLTPTKTDKQ